LLGRHSLLEPLHQHFFLCEDFFEIRSCKLCLGWLQISILLISASWVARITGMSHRCPVFLSYLLSDLTLCSDFNHHRYTLTPNSTDEVSPSSSKFKLSTIFNTSIIFTSYLTLVVNNFI
jgi:hypothetical protein